MTVFPKRVLSKINYKKLVRKRFPITTWLPQYTFSTFVQDLIAGLTVAMVEIPQGIAYAAIAGLPPQYGLFSGLADGFIYAILGGCKDINVGPGSLLSLLIQSSVLQAGPQAAILLTFLSGVIVLALGIMQLGFLINFFSYPVITGFINSGVIQIFLGQVINILGLSSKSNSVIDNCSTIVNQIYETRKWDTILGVTSLVTLLVLKGVGVFGTLHDRPDWSKRRNLLGKFIFGLYLARSAIILVTGTSIAYYFREDAPFKTAGQVADSFPTLQAPSFSTTFNGTYYSFGDLVSVFNITLMFIPLISILEELTLSKTFSKGKRIDGTQEMIAIGFCNLVGSFVGSMPVTGSFSRSTINHASGVRTTMGGVFTSLVLLLAIAFLTSAFRFVPKATLGAILISALMSLFELKAMILFWKFKKLDLLVFSVTFVIGLFFGTDYGILVGACFNCLFVLYANARPKFTVTKEVDCGSDVYVVTPRHTLYFPAAEYLRDKVVEFEGDNVTVVINGKYIRSMDITVARSVTNLTDELVTKNRKVVLWNFKESIKNMCIGVNNNMENHFFSDEDYKTVLRDESIVIA